MKKFDRASRFQAYIVPCTQEIERAKLEQSVENGQITLEEFAYFLTKLAQAYGPARG